MSDCFTRRNHKWAVYKILLLQWVLSGIYILACGLWNLEVMFSAFVGCVASLIPNSYFYSRMLRPIERDDAGRWLGHAYRSNVGKWLMTAMIFGLAFAADRLWDPVILFTGYVLTQLMSWVIFYFRQGPLNGNDV